MNPSIDHHAWWELHLRKARGEALSEQEEQWYTAEVARQRLTRRAQVYDLEDLKKMREQSLALREENEALRHGWRATLGNPPGGSGIGGPDLTICLAAIVRATCWKVFVDDVHRGKMVRHLSDLSLCGMSVQLGVVF